MRQNCWKCSIEGVKTPTESLHHINGHFKGQTIPLCKKHHDFIEGICGKCQEQETCWLEHFKQCWKYEDSVPPIHFREKTEERDVIRKENKTPTLSNRNSKLTLTAEERETIISWCDTDKNGKIWIHTTQKPMIRRLLKNPLFELEDEHRCNDYKDPLLGIDGYLPRTALTIRTRVKKLSQKQREALRNANVQRLLRTKQGKTPRGKGNPRLVGISPIKTQNEG